MFYLLIGIALVVVVFLVINSNKEKKSQVVETKPAEMISAIQEVVFEKAPEVIAKAKKQTVKKTVKKSSAKPVKKAAVKKVATKKRSSK